MEKLGKKLTHKDGIWHSIVMLDHSTMEPHLMLAMPQTLTTISSRQVKPGRMIVVGGTIKTCKRTTSECNYDHRCTYCAGWNHGFHNCRKRLGKQNKYPGGHTSKSTSPKGDGDKK